MAVKKEDMSVVSYVFGIAGIVLAFFQPLAGVVFGIVGIVKSREQNTPLAKKAKKLGIVAIVVGTVVLVLSLYLNYSLATSGYSSFPIA